MIANENLLMDIIQKDIREEAVKPVFLKDEETVWAAIQEATPEFILLEIGVSTLDGPELVQKLKQNAATRGIPIVVFGNSLRSDLLQDAREAGADLVLPKAAFREQLSELIRHYSKSSPS